MTFLIGIYVAIIAVSVTLFIKYLTAFKFDAVKACILVVSRRSPMGGAELYISIALDCTVYCYF